ncbi:MAG: hypothetical protein MJZ65_03505 [Paludibacteraceae bacterium]|nr:hypothetical protein [Paludibacteraceae bacterium]
MKRNVLIIALVLAVPALACAKKPKKQVVEETPAPVVETVVEEEPVVTDECMQNASLFDQSCKNKQYQDAYEPWLQVYNTCPTYTKAIYSKGAQILEWKYNNATTAEEKKAIAQLAMEMYDKRIKYFGNDPKYPEAYILGQKAVDYCAYFPEDELKLSAYEWLKKSVDGMGMNSQLKVLRSLAEVSHNIYKSNPEKYAEQYIADYSQVSGLLQQLWNDPASKNANDAGVLKEYVDGLFAVSGAASCDKMDDLYKNYVTTNGMYLEDMLKLMKLYKRVGCTDSEVYFAAAEAAHKLQPTEESAAGCAKMSMKKGEWKTACEYWDQALSLIPEDVVDDPRGEYLYNMAYSLFNMKRYADARSYARNSMESDPAFAGKCNLLIGLCYASSQPFSSSEYPAAKAAILNKTVFWAAVDKFQEARKYADCAEIAANYIATYSKFFPTQDDLFFNADLFTIGGSYVVGSWINERTTCRAAK